MSFEENRGQADPRVKFVARGIGYSLFLTSTDAVLKLRDAGPIASVAYGWRKYSILRIHLAGADAAARAAGVDPLPSRSNYFIGNNRSRWRPNVAAFASVKVRDIYPGIDVIYRGTEGRLEYDFSIAPGADPNRIRLNIEGARNLSIDAHGDLVIATSSGRLVQKVPAIYQISGGANQIIAGRYVMRDTHTIGFAIGAYDHRLPLVIDPLLSYASYLGGSLIDFGAAIAVDSSGAAIVTGYTDSADFPITAGAFQPELFEAAGGANDVFISKINPAGTALIYSTYAGGGNEDEGTAVAVDPAGNAYIAGYTMSPDYPVTVGALQTSFAGTKSAFVTALDPNGGLIYSTLLNGSATSSAAGIAVDAFGSAFITGVTTSTDFPVTPGAYQTGFVSSRGQDRAAFVAKLNPTGTALEYSTFLGPPNYTAGNALSVDALGNAYIAGLMYAGGSTGIATCLTNSIDCGFVARLDPLGGMLDFSTLLNFKNGGYTEPRSIAVDSAGDSHTVGNFGVTGSHFGFLANLDPDGEMSNFNNLSNALSPNAIALSRSDNILVAGTVFGNNLTPTPGAFQPDDAGSVNGFLNEYDASGTATLYSTYLGGGDQDEAFGVAVDPSGNAYVTGYTQSSDFPVTPGALQSTHGGGIAHAGTLDAFVARIVPSPALSPTPTSTASATPMPTATVVATATTASTPTAMRTPLPTRVPSSSSTPNAVPTISATAMPTPIPSPFGSIDAAPDPVDFHSLKIGLSSASRIVKVTNPATNKLSLTVTSLALGAADGGNAAVEFAVDASRSTCRPGLLLLAGKSCKVAIAFAPTSSGPQRGTLTVNAAARNIAKVVQLQGTGKRRH